MWVKARITEEAVWMPLFAMLPASGAMAALQLDHWPPGLCHLLPCNPSTAMVNCTDETSIR